MEGRSGTQTDLEFLFGRLGSGEAHKDHVIWNVFPPRPTALVYYFKPGAARRPGVAGVSIIDALACGAGAVESFALDGELESSRMRRAVLEMLSHRPGG